MDNIKDVVHQVIGQLAGKQANSNDDIQNIWPRVLSKQELPHARLVSFKEGTLVVYVDSPAWLFQMNLRKGKILDLLKESIPDVKRISFRVGKVK